MGNYPILEERSAKGQPVSYKTASAILPLLTSLEANQYFLDSLIQHHKKTGSPAGNLELIDKMQVHCHRLEKMQEVMRSPWLKGWVEVNATEGFNEVMVNELREKGLPDNMEELVNMVYTMDAETSQFLRVYLRENDEVVDEKRGAVLDSYWNLWLTKNKMVCQDGVIYRADENGENTQNKRVPSEELNRMMPGLEEYFKTKNFKVTVKKYEEVVPAPTPSSSETATKGQA